MAETQHTLSISSDFLAGMIVKVRGIQAKEGVVDPDSGSNPIDDNMVDVLQDDPNDLSRADVQEQLRGLDEREQAELVALMWIGRGDAEPEEWEETVKLARELKDGPTPRYLLRHPLVAEHWQEGAQSWGLICPSVETIETGAPECSREAAPRHHETVVAVDRVICSTLLGIGCESAKVQRRSHASAWPIKSTLAWRTLHDRCPAQSPQPPRRRKLRLGNWGFRTSSARLRKWPCTDQLDAGRSQ